MSEIDQAGMDSAHQCRIAGSYEQARDGYIQLTEAVPGCAEAWWGMGLTIMNMGEFDEAIECLKKAVELEPDNQRYVLDLGKHFAMLGMDDEAAQEEEKIAGIQEAARARWEEQLREALEAARAEKDADEGDAADDSGEVDDQPESAEDSTSVE